MNRVAPAPRTRRVAIALLALLLGLLCGGNPRSLIHARAAHQAAPLVVSFIDIGQGDSALLQTPSGKNILIDSGPPNGRQKLFDYLRLRGVRRLDMLVISHPHLDHYGNTLQLLRQIPTRTVLDSGLVTGSQTQEKILREIRDRRIRFQNVSRNNLAGRTRSLGDGISLRIMQPRSLLKNTGRDENNNSVIMKVTMGRVSMLFTGDLEKKGRERLLASNEDLKATVYKVSHHGSHNGTDDNLMQRVQPQEAVISSGKMFGHPHREALDTLDRIRARIWRTDQEGTIKLTTDGQTYQIFGLGR